MDINIFRADLENTLAAYIQNSNINFGSTENVIYFFDYDLGKYDYISNGIVQLTGYTADEINQIGFSSLIKEVLQASKSIDTNKISEMPGFMVEDASSKYLIKTRDGKLKWVENISFAKIDKNGKRENCIGVLKNVTSMHLLFDHMQEEKNKLDAILDIAEIMFVVLDNNYNVIFINKKGCSILDYSKEEILGKNWAETFIPDEMKEKTAEHVKNFFNGTADYFELHENELLTRLGEKRLISWHNAVIRDEDNKPKYIIASGYDVTKARRDEKIQQMIYEILHVANSETDLDELFRLIHKCISNLMSAENFYISLYDKENKLIRFPYFVDQYDDDAPPKKFGKGLTEYVLTTGKPALVTREKDNELVAIGATEMIGTPAAIWLGVPLKILNNTIGAMVVQDYHIENTYGEKEQEILEVISYPISRAIERKIVEQERNELITKLKELNESKDRLFSLISHDLRSPFNSLLGFSEILTTEYDSLTEDEIKEYLNVIYESSKNLYSMTNNLLQFSRFQIGRFEFNPVKIILKRLMLSNINLLRGNIIKKQLNLNIDIDVDSEVFADEDMLNSIVQNLLSNAIKFTNRGGEIKVRGRILTSQDNPDLVEISVEDSGVGISEEDVVKIFKDHMHSSPGTEKEYGTGLGLLLVKEFVQINGGEISIKSKVGKGTIFTFTLPVLN